MLDNDDLTAMGDAILYPDEDDFVDHYPGLEGSLGIHADFDESGVIDEDDEDMLEWQLAANCDGGCMAEGEYYACYADLNKNGSVDLGDLATLLANYGMTSGATRDDGDLDGDGNVDLSDLAEILGRYGETCGCFPPADPPDKSGGKAPLVTYVNFSVAGIDTSGYTGGGFVGEVDHFVLDLRTEVKDPNNDDWIVTGAALDASNDAEFRLSAASSYPDQYATFVAAPWTTLPGSATAGVAGAYDPADPNAAFATDEINIGWYDTSASSHDGPATVMRIVLDVSDVADADVSGGFGAVYFGKAKRDVDDILVAELAAGAGTKLSQGGLVTFGGSFFVTGQ